jgi:hypothetical protein
MFISKRASIFSRYSLHEFAHNIAILNKLGGFKYAVRAP